MNTRELTEEDKLYISSMVSKILAPISATVSIGKMLTIKCFRTAGHDGRERVEWTEYRYPMHIRSIVGNLEYSDSFLAGVDLSRVAWLTAWRAYSFLDGNIHGTLAQNLWPANNNYRPDPDL